MIDMKTKKLHRLALCFVAIAGLGLLAPSCSDDDKDETSIAFNQLPQNAQSFILQYFPDADITRVEMDRDHEGGYDVYMSDGAKVEFNGAGEWTDVRAANGGEVPAAIIPQPIQEYLATHYPDTLVKEISLDARGYEVELNVGLDLDFDPQGNFISIDR